MGRKIIILFSVALITRLIALSFFATPESLIHKDSEDYVAVAENMLTRGIYSMDTGDAIRPDNFRTPLYPFFLVPFIYFGTSYYTIAIVQDILTALCAVLIYYLGKKLVGEKVAFWSSLLFSLEPYSALLNNQLLTEWLFTITLAPALLLLALYAKEKRPKYIYLCAVLFALAALTKPLALPLLALIPIIACFIKHDRRVLYPALIITLIVAPWIVRNKISIDKWSFSTIGEYNLYNYNAKHFDRWLLNRGAADNKPPYPTLSLDNYHRPEKATAYFEAGKNYILSRPLAYSAFIIIKLPALFLDTGYTTLVEGLGAGKLLSGFIVTGGEIFFLLVTILAVISLAFRFRYLGITLLAFALVASPFGAARYRIAINPILFMLALNTLFILHEKLRKNPVQELIHS